MSRFVVALVLGWLAALTSAGAEPALKRVEWQVGDVTREALIHTPLVPRDLSPARPGFTAAPLVPRDLSPARPGFTAAPKAEASPLVFVFHGHGGTMKYAATKMAIHSYWPEVICVYPQGLNTPGKLTDPAGKKSGWQSNPRDQDDRDLKFFDEMLKSLRKDYKVDDKRVFVTGHSNGGRFTQLLWAERGDVFAAVAPSGTTATTLTRSLKPKPCLHIAGEKDELVRFAWQKQTMDAVLKINGCEPDGKPWQKGANPPGTLYDSKTGTPLVTYVYSGGHMPPEDTPKRIAAFFKEQAKK